MSEEVGKARQENADLQQQVQQLSFLVNKLRGEISEKDSMLGRGFNENDQELSLLRQQI